MWVLFLLRVKLVVVPKVSPPTSPTHLVSFSVNYALIVSDNADATCAEYRPLVC